MGVACVWAGPSVAVAAELPPHDPVRLLIVSDEVNPHGLGDGELTQPGDLHAALMSPGSGLSIDLASGSPGEVSSSCIDDALEVLANPGELDVVVYFAHRPATGCDGTPQQQLLTASMEAHLQAGGGVVVFHHGIYEAGGKEDILQLLGGRASSVMWDVAAGQDVIAVAPGHFVVEQGMGYSGMRGFGGVGVPDGEYPFFNNTPDERYDALELLTAAGEERTLLFVSADGGGGSPRVLGYDLWRPGWMGRVVFYQPGEYEPNALDVDGLNFQVLANAILHAATTEEDPGPPPGEDTGGEPGDGSGGVDESGGGNEAGDATGGGEVGDGTGGASSDGAGADGGDGDSGCGCRSTGVGGPAGLLGLGLAVLGLRSRRRRRC